ncbi:MAG TPA: hypothetical protein VK955_12025, partial [Xanthobacteraceae bacterium]|nr:hypothetical protein [Xanthobacteraceae bacterium]
AQGILIRRMRIKTPRSVPSLFGYFFGQCQKVTGSPQARRSSALQETKKGKELDYTRLLSRALRAIRSANVRFGILPPQSGLRRNDELVVKGRIEPLHELARKPAYVSSRTLSL